LSVFINKLTGSLKDKDKYVLDFYQKLNITYSFFTKNELRNHAAAGAFYLLVSLVPLFLLLMFIFETFLKSYPSFSKDLFIVLAIFNEKLTPELFEKFQISKKAGSAIGAFGLLNLLFTSRLMLASIQRAFAVIFPAEKKRNFIKENFISIGIIPILIIFVVVVSALTSTKFILLKYLQVSGISIYYIAPILNLLLYIVPGLIAFLLVFFTYRYLPVRRPDSKSALKGALLFVIMFVLVKSAAYSFVIQVSTNTAYGVLGSVFIILIWSYFVFLLFLFCAQYVFVTYRADYLILNQLFSDERPDHKFMVINKKVLEKFTMTIPAEETLFNMGDESVNVYYVLSGRLNAIVKDKVIGTITEGEIFGEMAHITDEPRSADVKAAVDSELVVMPPRIFNEIVRDNKDFARRTMETLCNRLKRAQFMGRFSG